MPRRNPWGLPARPEERRLVLALCATTMLGWIGGSSILPLLPTYLRSHGSTPGVVGLVMASYFAASVLTQYPAGRLSDRIGRQPVLMAGLVLFAIGSFGFAFTTQPLLAIVCRSCQGIGAGAIVVAAAAAIGSSVQFEDRGGAYGALYGSQMLALAIGPLVGSVVGATSMRVLFLAAGVCALAAGALLLAMTRGLVVSKEVAAAATSAGELGVLAGAAPAWLSATAARLRIVFNPAVGGTLVSFFAVGLIVGVYETCWSLLLRARGGSSLAIGVSWTLFALPYALLSLPAGRLANRLDRRKLAIVAVAASAAFCSLYPFLHSVRMLIGFGPLEACCAVVGGPAALLILSEATPSAVLGEVQGALESARTAAIALSAAASGALFSLSPAIPFTLAAALAMVGCVVMARAWRHVPGRGAAASSAAP